MTIPIITKNIEVEDHIDDAEHGHRDHEAAPLIKFGTAADLGAPAQIFNRIRAQAHDAGKEAGWRWRRRGQSQPRRGR